MERKNEIISLLEEVIKKDIPLDERSSEIKELKSEFVDLVKHDHDELLTAFLNEGGKKDDFKPPHDEFDGKFSDLMSKFNALKKRNDEQKAHEFIQNLEVKKKIIHDLEKLIEEEQHIGHAFEKFNELKEKWKVIGNVAPSEYKELHRAYSHAIERFFYNINIYKTLKEYDLLKNLQLKTDLTAKVRLLVGNKNINEIRDLISAYVKEWDDVGPTYQNQWEKVRDEFWEAVREIHKKIGDHYQDLKDKQKENLQKKSELCEAAEALLSNEIENPKQFKKLQIDFDKIRIEWKQYGFAGKGKNDQVWKRFKKSLDSFNEKRKLHFTELKDEFKIQEEKKIKLIERAKALKDSTDWKNSAESFKKLQQEWKRTGATFNTKEQKLWKAFRSASDHFFNQRKAYFDGREDREKGNLDSKLSLLKKLENLETGNGGETYKAIEEIGKEWNAIGYVPIEEKGKVEDQFAKLISSKLKSAGLNQSEVEEKSFELKVVGLKESENSAELLRNEHLHLDEKLRKIESNIKQYENNLGFFGENAKNNPILKEVLEKLDHSKKEASKIKERIQLLVK